MSFTDRLLISILGAVVVWLTTTIVAYVVKKARLRSAILADIAINVAGAKEQRAAVARLIEEHAHEGQKLPFPISYNVGDYLLYKSIQKDLLTYLKRTELIKVIKFYHTLWAMDVSINGLASTLGKWEQNGVTLSREQVDHLRKRKERIDSFCAVLSEREIRSLEDLPDDYRTVKNAETIVAKT
jgi:hypothetical protein